MIELNHGQRKTVAKYWHADRIDWLLQECQLALAAGPNPLKETRRARKALKERAARLSKLTQAAIDQLEALESCAGEAADILAHCEARAGDIRNSLVQSRDFAWQLESDLERLGADRKPEERTTLLIRRIARALKSDGLPVNDLETGPLFQITGVALGIIGVPPKDLRGTVRQVLAREGTG